MPSIHYQVRSHYGTDQFSRADFNNYDVAHDYAEKQRKAMPIWYKKVEIIQIEELTLKQWFHTPDYPLSR